MAMSSLFGALTGFLGGKLNMQGLLNKGNDARMDFSDAQLLTEEANLHIQKNDQKIKQERRQLSADLANSISQITKSIQF